MKKCFQKSVRLGLVMIMLVGIKTFPQGAWNGKQPILDQTTNYFSSNILSTTLINFGDPSSAALTTTNNLYPSGLYTVEDATTAGLSCGAIAFVSTNTRSYQFLPASNQYLDIDYNSGTGYTNALTIASTAGGCQLFERVNYGRSTSYGGTITNEGSIRFVNSGSGALTFNGGLYDGVQSVSGTNSVTNVVFSATGDIVVKELGLTRITNRQPTFEKNGSGTLTIQQARILAGTFDITGNWKINAGTVAIGAIGALGATPSIYTSNQLLLDGATLESMSNLTVEVNRGLQLGANGGTLQVDAGITQEVDSVISGSGGNLNKTGSGVLSLAGVNSYNGNTTVTGGTLALIGAGSLTSSPVIKVLDGAVLDVSGLTNTFSLATNQTLMNQPTLPMVPYVSDTNTLFLFHFDDDPGSVATTNAGTKGGSAYAVNLSTITPTTDSSMLGVYWGYWGESAFNHAENNNSNGCLIGYDANNLGGYMGETAESFAMTNLNMGNGGLTPWTIEALIQPTVTNANNAQEIISTDSSNQRGFQFRINSQGLLQLNFISGGPNITAAIPSIGPNAFESNSWYHVAATYDGTNVVLYWTLMDAVNQQANAIATNAASIGTSFGSVNAPLCIGGENRSTNQEYFQGLIDEVRISSVCRGPYGMLFHQPKPAVIAGNLNASVGTLCLNYVANEPALTVSNGTLTMASTTTLIISNNGPILSAGNYKIIKSSGGSVSGLMPVLTVIPGPGLMIAGNGVAGLPSLGIINGELYLNVATNWNTPKVTLVLDSHVTTNALVFPNQNAGFGQYINGGLPEGINLVTFSNYQYTTWYDTNTIGGTTNPTVWLARRTINGTNVGAWNSVNTGSQMSNSIALGWDAHNVISLGICPLNGTLHMSWDQHAQTLRYRQSVPGLCSTNQAAWGTTNMLFPEQNWLVASNQPVSSFTYPCFITTPTGGLIFEYRLGISGNGDTWMQYYNPSTFSWNMPWKVVFGESGSGSYTGLCYQGNVITTSNRNAYDNGLDFAPDGTLHYSWCFREYKTHYTNYNHDINYAYSTNGGLTWLNGSGTVLANSSNQVITVNSPGITVKALDGEQQLINQQAQCVDTAGWVHLVMYHRRNEPGFEWLPTDSEFSGTGTAYYHYFRNPATGVWSERRFPTDNAVGQVSSIAADSAGNLFAAFTSGNHLMVATTSAAVGYYWQIVITNNYAWGSGVKIDKARLLRDGVLSVYGQQQGPSQPYVTGTTLHVVDYVAQAAPARLLANALFSHANNFSIALKLATVEGSGVSSSNLMVLVQSEINHNYQLQCRTNLNAGEWINVGSPRPGTGGLLGLPQPDGTWPDQQFYRVLKAP